MVVYNQSDLAERAVKSATCADEIVIVDQGSDDEHAQKLKSLATIYHRTTNKGNGDLDRQFCYSLAKKDFILALDADEFIEPEELTAFSDLLQEFNFEVAWFLFKNTISSNGKTIDLQKMLGDDPHPRFWKKIISINGQWVPAMNWPHEAHKFPNIATEKQAFLRTKINHDRRLEDVIKTHLNRGKIIDENARKMEKEFVSGVLREFGDEVFQNVKLKFPELVNYLKGTSNGR
jgi:glycosyltransferase involved in cell wall biosynthesis